MRCYRIASNVILALSIEIEVEQRLVPTNRWKDVGSICVFEPKSKNVKMRSSNQKWSHALLAVGWQLSTNLMPECQQVDMKEEPI